MVDSFRPSSSAISRSTSGAHGQLAMHEEVLLPLDDGARDAQDGVEALLDVLDEPAGLLQALLQGLVPIAPLWPAQAPA